MISIYVSLIGKGLKTIDDVPDKLREAVRVLLGASGGEEAGEGN